VEFRILGPLGGPRERVLLARLLISAGLVPSQLRWRIRLGG
jgi:hypothetical protein